MRRNTGFEHRGETNVKKVVLIAGGAVLLLVAWILMVTSIGGASSQEQAGSKDDGREGRQDLDSNAASGRGAPDAPSENEGTLRMSHEGETAYITPENLRQAERKKYADDVPDGGVSNEPGSYDPLGVEPEPGVLSKRDAERAELAAAEFVTAAYGYTGEDKNEYNQGVGRTVVWPGFYDSTAAARIQKYASEVEDSGTKSAAKVTDFETRSISGGFGKETIKAIVTFDTADTYNRYGEIEGSKQSYRQRMTLKRDGAIFKVAAAEEIEEVAR